MRTLLMGLPIFQSSFKVKIGGGLIVEVGLLSRKCSTFLHVHEISLYLMMCCR